MSQTRSCVSNNNIESRFKVLSSNIQSLVHIRGMPSVYMLNISKMLKSESMQRHSFRRSFPLQVHPWTATSVACLYELADRSLAT